MKTKNRDNSVLTYVSLILGFFMAVSSCGTIKPKKQYLKQFDNSVIVANEQYFTRAVLEYYLAKAIIAKFGIKFPASDPNNPLDNNTQHNIMAISFNPKDHSELSMRDPKLAIRTCRFKIPQELKDLTSGLEYRYYLFDGTMQASMQAFGIAEGSSEADTKYLIIDYLQYKDCFCDGLPTIRYAVGIRTELKFIRMSSKSKFTGVGSLAGIAAEVQLGQSKVTFSLKSIGLTGPAVRFNIPSGVDFDVTSYREFQNAIDFLRGLEIKEKVDPSKLYIQPVIIPILDDYRTSLGSSMYDMVKEVHKLNRMRKKILRLNKTQLVETKDYCNPTSSDYDLEKCNLKRQVNIIDRQIDFYINERESSQQADSTLTYFTKYGRLVEIIQENESDFRDQFEKLLNPNK